MSKAKKIIAVLAAAVSALSFTGCGESTKWIAEYDGEKLNAGLYLYYELSAYDNVLTYLKKTDETVDEVTKDDNYFIEDTQQTVNAYEWIKSYALENIEKYLVVESEFDRLGLELSEEDLKNINETVDYYYSDSAFAENYSENGISKDSLLLLYTNNYKYSELFYALYGTYEKKTDDGKTETVNGEFNISDDELWEFFTEHNARVKLITFKLYDKDYAALSDEEVTAVKEMVQDYSSRLEKGESFDDLIAEYADYTKSLTDSNDDANDTSGSIVDASGNPVKVEAEVESDTDTDTDTDEEEDEYANEVIVTDESTTYSEATVKSIFEMTADGKTPKIIYDEDDKNEIYLVVRYDLHERTDLFESNTKSIIADIAGDAYDEYLKGLTANQLVYTLNEKAVDRYQPKKLVLEDSSSK